MSIKSLLLSRYSLIGVSAGSCMGLGAGLTYALHKCEELPELPEIPQDLPDAKKIEALTTQIGSLKQELSETRAISTERDRINWLRGNQVTCLNKAMKDETDYLLFNGMGAANKCNATFEEYSAPKKK